MSDKRMNEIGRRQRFRRRLRGEKKAVSPVVATLILILIAVAAAAALYLWLVAWQGGVTSGIGSPGAQYTVTIGGSTSVYPFAEQAATWFDANNSDVSISVNQGGSGAGMAAVCSGQVDIGEASTFYGTGAQPAATPGAIQTQYGCPYTVSVEVIAYDGVDTIVPVANPHGLQNTTWDTLQAIYFDGMTLSPGDTAYAGSNVYALGNYHFDTYVAAIDPAQGTGYAWNEIPACATAAIGYGGCAGSTVAFQPVTAAGTIITTGATPTSISPTTINCGAANSMKGFIEASTATALEQAIYSVVMTDPTLPTCSTTAATSDSVSAVTISNSNFDVVSGTGYVFANVTFTFTMTGGTGTAPVTEAGFAPAANYEGQGTGVSKTFTTACGGSYPNDICGTSGTTATPCGFTVCAGGSNSSIDIYTRSDVSGTQQSFESRLLAIGASGGIPQGLGFTGCPTGDNQWDACNVVPPTKYAENGNPAVITAVAGDNNGIGFASDGLAQASGLVLPINFQGYGQTVVVKIVGESTALAAIALAIEDHEGNVASYATAQAYVGWRPFLNVETSPPTGEVLRYLQWVMDPANNQAVAAATYEISVYASGLAGHVPVTPIP